MYSRVSPTRRSAGKPCDQSRYARWMSTGLDNAKVTRAFLRLWCHQGPCRIGGVRCGRAAPRSGGRPQREVSLRPVPAIVGDGRNGIGKSPSHDRAKKRFCIPNEQRKR